MKNKLNIIFACFYLLTNILSAGQVICNGDDGHTSIEKRHLSNHCPTTHENHENHDHPNEIISEIEDHCEPCVDTPLQNDAKRLDKNQETLVCGLLETYSNVVVDHSLNPSLNFSYPPRHNKPDQILAMLRTIVLII